MAEREENEYQITPRRMTFFPPSQMQQKSFGRGRLAKEALSYVQTLPSPKMGRGLYMSPGDSRQPGGMPECPCERNTKNILCQACGHMFVGRIRMSCPIHPKIIHLMDISCCPQCRANHLKEFSDYEEMKRE